MAALPMYELPGLENAHAAWWEGIARHLRAAGLENVPARLMIAGTPAAECSRDPYAVWRDPGLLLSQTCGYPLVHSLLDAVRVIATPRYAAPGCHGAEYCSLVLVRADSLVEHIADLSGCAAVINGWDSQSGMSALRAVVAPSAGQRGGRYFRAVKVSGSHLASIRQVAHGQADVCAVDCVTHALLAKHMPERLIGTRVLCRTPSAPALPYITAARNAPLLPRLRAGLEAAANDPELAEVRATLLIDGFAMLTDDVYNRILELEESAAAQGYPDLR